MFINDPVGRHLLYYGLLRQLLAAEDVGFDCCDSTTKLVTSAK
jgi:hypothetical protein